MWRKSPFWFQFYKTDIFEMDSGFKWIDIYKNITRIIKPRAINFNYSVVKYRIINPKAINFNYGVLKYRIINPKAINFNYRVVKYRIINPKAITFNYRVVK